RLRFRISRVTVLPPISRAWSGALSVALRESSAALPVPPTWLLVRGRQQRVGRDRSGHIVRQQPMVTAGDDDVLRRPKHDSSVLHLYVVSRASSDSVCCRRREERQSMDHARSSAGSGYPVRRT